MTLHVILGDGEMTQKELAATLDDLWEQEGDGSFWFLLQGKSDPTSTDQALTNWLTKNELFFAILTDDKASLHQCYNGAAQTFVAKGLTKKVLALIESEPEEDELVDILALFTSDDPDAEDDRWLNDLMGEIAESGHTIRALNDGLTVLDFEKEPEDDPKEEPVVAKTPTKSKTKAKPVVDEQPQLPGLEDEPEEENEITREWLETLSLNELKDLAKTADIELPPRTRSTTYIDAILGVDDTPEAEIEDVASTNGHVDIDIDALADQITIGVIETLIKKLEEAIA